MRISELCKRDVVTCPRDTSAAQVAKLLRDGHVGDVVVVERRNGKTMPVGIITDRDLVVHVLAAKVDAETVVASDLITGELTTAEESEDIYDALWHMRSKGVRRLPIVDDHGALVGVLAMDDVMQYLGDAMSQLARISPYQVTQERGRLRS